MGKGLSGVSSGKGAWCSNCALTEKKVYGRFRESDIGALEESTAK